MAAITLLKWSFGNDKLIKTKTVSFNLPALRSARGFIVCPMAGICASFCYARQGRYMFPATVAARELNLAIVRADLAQFEDFAKIDLARIKAETIRVHDSGDFFSQDYLDTWFRIMQAFPRQKFYAYTKSLHLDWTATPPNFQVVQSVGGKMDHAIDYSRSHTKVFVSGAARKLAGYKDGNRTDRAAQRGEIKIGFVYHGSIALTPVMARVIDSQERKG